MSDETQKENQEAEIPMREAKGTRNDGPRPSGRLKGKRQPKRRRPRRGGRS